MSLIVDSMDFLAATIEAQTRRPVYYATYINDLWKLDKQWRPVKDISTATGSAVAAIIGANLHPSLLR